MQSLRRVLQPFRHLASHRTFHSASAPFKWLANRPSSSNPARSLFTSTLKTIFLFHVLTEYCYSTVETRGASMLPTFEVRDDWVLIDKGYRRGRGVQVGDVVSFDSVVEPGVGVIKRVLGLAGDYVMLETPETGSTKMIQVPKGHCWVVGDNLPFSRDSRHFGPLPMALIRGKIMAKIAPWSERRWIENGLQPYEPLS